MCVPGLVSIVQLCLWLGFAQASQSRPEGAVSPQYDSTHVYVAPENFDTFIASFIATFGGAAASKEGEVTVTPTPSSTLSQVVLTPVGTLSVFGYRTPIPYPFGMERTGHLVADLDMAIRDARADGADLLVAPFNDPIGRDAIIQWSGGVSMQLYWHKVAPSYAVLKTIPEDRIYVSRDRADPFTHGFLAFTHGTVISDESQALGVEIGRLSDTYRRIRIRSKFGLVTVFETDGHLPYPYGRESTGYEVTSLHDTLAKAKAAGATVLDGPYTASGRNAAMVQFPGGYIAEIHSPIAETTGQ